MDAVSAANRRAHVETQLAMYSGEKRKMGEGSTFVCCPFHSERTPSGRVFHGPATRSPGYFKCYGCGKGAKWDDLAPLIGLQAFVNGPPKEMYATPTSVKRDVDENEDQAFVLEKQRNKRKLPRDKVWRGISTNLLRDIGAYTAEFYAKGSSDNDGYWTGRRLYLPVLISGTLRGYIKARLHKHPDYPSYINASGPWSRTHGLFPYDYSIKLATKIANDTGGPVTMVLVEGQRDALRLLSMGIPAMCILGTQSWSATKCKLLELGGVERVILFMDGDVAGLEATERIEPSVRQMFDTRVLKLWAMTGSPIKPYLDLDDPMKVAKAKGVECWDPGNAPPKILQRLHQKFFT